MSKASPIGDVVKNVFGQIESQQTLSKEDIEGHWRSVAGEASLKHSKPVSLDKGELTVWVDSSAWMQELTMRKRQLLKGLKRILGQDRISEIHFKIGEF